MSWKRVCAASDVAALCLKAFDVDGVPILIANLGDEYRAFPPLCPHMEEPLENSGIFDPSGVLTCTKHLWQWDMRTGERRGEAEKDLLNYDVKREGDDILAFVVRELNYDYEEEDDYED